MGGGVERTIHLSPMLEATTWSVTVSFNFAFIVYYTDD